MCNSQPHNRNNWLSFYNTIERGKIVRGYMKFRHVTLYVVHWASNATTAIEIFPNAHQTKWR